MSRLEPEPWDHGGGHCGLVTAVLMEISEDRETGIVYLKPEENGRTL